MPCVCDDRIFQINTWGKNIYCMWQSCLRLNHLLSFRRRDRKEEDEEGADRRKWRLSRNVSSHDVARPDIWSNNNTNFVYRGNLLSGRCVYSGCSPFIVRNIRRDAHVCRRGDVWNTPVPRTSPVSTVDSFHYKRSKLFLDNVWPAGFSKIDTTS